MGRKYALGFFIAFLVCFAVIFADKIYHHLIGFNSSGLEGTSSSPEEKNTIPDVTLTVVSGERSSVQLSSYKGKILLINFWASWCEVCMEEIPTIVKAYNMLKNQGFEVVSINVDENPWKIVPEIVKKFDIQFPIYIDSEQRLASAFHVVAIPYNIVVNKNFRVAWVESGDRNWASEESIDKIRGLLK